MYALFLPLTSISSARYTNPPWYMKVRNDAGKCLKFLNEIFVPLSLVTFPCNMNVAVPSTCCPVELPWNIFGEGQLNNDDSAIFPKHAMSSVSWHPSAPSLYISRWARRAIKQESCTFVRWLDNSTDRHYLELYSRERPFPPFTASYLVNLHLLSRKLFGKTSIRWWNMVLHHLCLGLRPVPWSATTTFLVHLTCIGGWRESVRVFSHIDIRVMVSFDVDRIDHSSARSTWRVHGLGEKFNPNLKSGITRWNILMETFSSRYYALGDSHVHTSIISSCVVLKLAIPGNRTPNVRSNPELLPWWIAREMSFSPVCQIRVAVSLKHRNSWKDSQTGSKPARYVQECWQGSDRCVLMARANWLSGIESWWWWTMIIIRWCIASTACRKWEGEKNTFYKDPFRAPELRSFLVGQHNTCFSLLFIKCLVKEEDRYISWTIYCGKCIALDPD